MGGGLLAEEQEEVHGSTDLLSEVYQVSACHLLPPAEGTEGKKEVICLMEFVRGEVLIRP
jgi:hypothetical protein